jgi:outer membrane protein W
MTKKTMKKSLMALILGLGTASLVNAQQKSAETPKDSGFYVSVQGGYNLPMAQQTLEYFDLTNTTSIPGPDRYENIPVSFGKGANVGLNLGYMFTKNMGAELGFNYLMGSEYTVSTRYNSDPNRTIDRTMSAKMMQFKPAMVFRTQFNKLSPYAKVGLLVGVGSKIKLGTLENDPDYNYRSEERWEYDGGTSFGMHGALGAEYAINNKIGVFGEITGTGLTYAPKKGKMVTYTENGVDYLSDYDVRQKEIDFQNGSYVDDGGKDKPKKVGKQYTPFSSIGLNVGVRFKF